MTTIRGIFHFIISIVAVITGITLVLLMSWIPIYIRSARLSVWVVVATARTLLLINRVQVHFTDKEALQTHAGFIFANHTTYLDILVLLGYFPARFLAMQEIRSWPLIGYAASSIGCVFVDRDDKSSRTQARQALAYTSHTPPIVIYPEGKLGTGERLQPFHSGSFQVAVAGEVALLPCAISYDPLEIAIWHRTESPFNAFMRVCTYTKPIYVTVTCLPIIRPNANDDAVALSIETRDRLEPLISHHKRERMSV